MDLVQASFSQDAEDAAAAIERLCQVVASDGVLLAALGGHPRLLPRLRDILDRPTAAADVNKPAGATAAATDERLCMSAAFLVSQLAGKTAAIDSRLLDQRFIPALVAAAAAPAGSRRDGWGRRRGALRSISKLLAAQPACAAAQLVACGGVGLVAGLLEAEDADLVPGSAGVVARRCLSILRCVAEVTPGGGAAAGLLHPAVLSPLVRVLAGMYRDSGNGAEVLQEGAALLELLTREPGVAPQLAAAGAGAVLSSLAFSGAPDPSRLAEQALQHLQRQEGWRVQQALPKPPPMQSAGRSGGASQQQSPLPSLAARPSAMPQASSEQPPLLPLPEQRQLPGAGVQEAGATQGGQLGRYSACTSLGSASSSSRSIARVQEWQQQLVGQGQGSTQPQVGASPTAPSNSSAGQGGGFSSGHASVAALVVAQRSGASRTRLAAAEQLAALAASGSRAAAVITAAGGGGALVACVCESAAGPVTVQDTLQDAYEEALREGVCTAALRALCTLCQQAPGATAALPPVAPSLRLLLAGPDSQQRQLAAMLLASIKAGHPPHRGRVAAAPPGAASAQAAQPPSDLMHASGAGVRQPAALPPSPDLLPTSTLSLPSELEPGAAHNTTPSSVLHQPPSTPGSGSLFSLGSDGPHRQLVLGGSSVGGMSGEVGALHRLPTKARRQLGQLLRTKLPPPSAQGGASTSLAMSPRAPDRSYSAGPTLKEVQLWGTGSEASVELGTEEQQAASKHRAPSTGRSREAGSAVPSAAEAGPHVHGGTLLIPRSDITICQDQAGHDWKLGEGGFGVVLKGLMHGVDEVAVKCIKAEAPSGRWQGEAELATFHCEVHLLASLRHRNIVQYYGACLEPGSLFFVTELMKGGDLYTALRHHPAALAWGRLGLRVALDIALGLNYLHSRRPAMSHRDLKSPNVLLSEEGVAKIGDVGMVRPQVADLITAQPLMTPLWAAPEVLRRERAGVKADIWSYGLLVWELVSGADIADHQPLAFTRTLEVQQQQGAQAPAAAGGAATAVVEMPVGAPPVAVHIFGVCTQLDPALRPNAQQIVEWLRGSG